VWPRGAPAASRGAAPASHAAAWAWPGRGAPGRQRPPGRARRRAPPAGRPTRRRVAGPPRERPRPPGGGGGTRAQRPPAGMPARAAATVRMRAGERAGPKARARAGSAPCPSPGRSRGTAARPPARRRRSPAPAGQRPDCCGARRARPGRGTFPAPLCRRPPRPQSRLAIAKQRVASVARAGRQSHLQAVHGARLPRKLHFPQPSCL